MSLATSIDSAIKEAGLDDNEFGNAAERAIVAELKEPALRAEVYEKVDHKENPLLEDLSMAYVHEILDALVEILEGR